MSWKARSTSAISSLPASGALRAFSSANRRALSLRTASRWMTPWRNRRARASVVPRQADPPADDVQICRTVDRCRLSIRPGPVVPPRRRSRRSSSGPLPGAWRPARDRRAPLPRSPDLNQPLLGREPVQKPSAWRREPLDPGLSARRCPRRELRSSSTCAGSPPRVHRGTARRSRDRRRRRECGCRRSLRAAAGRSPRPCAMTSLVWTAQRSGPVSSSAWVCTSIADEDRLDQRAGSRSEQPFLDDRELCVHVLKHGWWT